MPKLTLELLTQVATNQYTQVGLDLSNNKLDEKAVQDLCRALAQNKVVKNLKLCQCGITEQMGQVLVNNQTLTSLDMSGNEISSGLEKAIQAQMIRNKLNEEKQTQQNASADANSLFNKGTIVVTDQKTPNDEKTRIQTLRKEKYEIPKTCFDFRDNEIDISAIRDWDMKEEKEIIISETVSYGRSARTPLVVLSNEHYIACFGHRTQVLILNIISKKFSQNLNHDKEVTDFIALPNNHIACATGKIVKIWNAETGQSVRNLEGFFQGHSAEITALVLLPNGWLASGSADGVIKLWNLTTGNCEKTLKDHSNESNYEKICGLAVSINGGLVSASRKKIIIWNKSSWIKEKQYGINERINKFFALPDGNFIYREENDGDESCKYLDIHQNENVKNIKPNHVIFASKYATLLPDGRLIDIQGGQILILPTKPQQEGNNYKGCRTKTKNATYGVTVLPDGRLVSLEAEIEVEKGTWLTFEKVKNKALRFWTLGLKRIKFDTFIPLIDNLQSKESRVKCLNLQNTLLTDEHVPRLLAALLRTTVHTLDICNTEVTKLGASKLYEGYKKASRPIIIKHESMDSIIKEQLAKQKAEQEARLEAERKRIDEEAQLKAKREHAEKEALLKLKQEKLERLEHEEKVRIAEEGDAETQYYLSECYFKGKGNLIKKDIVKSLQWCRKAAEQGYAEAEWDLGCCYEKGIGVRKDQNQALEWYERAAKKNNDKAIEASKRLLKEKFESQLVLAKQDNIEAQIYVGICYLNGNDVEVDYAQAVFWLNKAAKKDDMEAQYQLGRCSENGWFVDKDIAQATVWYKKAVSQGHLEARNNLSRIQRQLADEKATATVPLVQSSATVKNQAQSVFVSSVPMDSKVTLPKNVSNSYVINYAELQIGKELGRGGYGVVHQATWRFTPVAVKQLLIANPKSDALEEFKGETQIMAKLRSPNIIQFYGCVLGNPTYCIVMEYMPKGSLYSVLHNDKEVLNWETRYRMVTDIACGLAFLHSESILHRDLKSLNVLLDEYYRAKLTDFGLSKIKNETRSSSSSGGVVGTYAWMAPELINDDARYTQKADIYSLGITFWEVAARRVPFKDENPMLIPIKASQGKREAIPADCPPKIASLIKFCWHSDPAKRPVATRVVEYLRSPDEKEFTEASIVPVVNAMTTPQTNYPGNLNSPNANIAADYVGNLNSGISYAK